MPGLLVPLGELVTTHGREGWLKLKPYNPQTTSLSCARAVFLEKGGSCASHFLQESKAFKGLFLVKFQGIDGIDEAKPWVGSVLSIAQETLPPPGPGEYYYYQVLGLDVFNTQGEWIGKITRIWFKEGGHLYVVSGPTREHLIPAVKEVIEKIDLAAGQMIINPPPGLLDL